MTLLCWILGHKPAWVTVWRGSLHSVPLEVIEHLGYCIRCFEHPSGDQPAARKALQEGTAVVSDEARSLKVSP